MLKKNPPQVLYWSKNKSVHQESFSLENNNIHLFVKNESIRCLPYEAMAYTKIS